MIGVLSHASKHSGCIQVVSDIAWLVSGDKGKGGFVHGEGTLGSSVWNPGKVRKKGPCCRWPLVLARPEEGGDNLGLSPRIAGEGTCLSEGQRGQALVDSSVLA